MKIIFHDNSLSIRGTTVALFDYAFFCKKLLDVDCQILYNEHHHANEQLVVDKFKKEFEIVRSYRNPSEMQQIINEINPYAFFMIKSGPWDNVFSNSCKNWINAIAPCKKNQMYGDKFLMGSKWLSDISDGIDYVPYMVNLPDVKTNLREELGIPKDSIVFGRNGGRDSFDISFAKQAVIDILKEREDIFFIFQGTEKFHSHERIIHMDGSADLENKVKFINTSDALIHARQLGESFGQTCAEFSHRNKPVITWFGSPERNHIDILGDVGLFYNNYDDLMQIFRSFEPNPSKNWNRYDDYLPEVVMDRFQKLYLN